MNYNVLQYRIKQIIKRNVLRDEEPFLCVITPVFDPCLKSLEGLIADLQKQTFTNFIHVNIANGNEPKILELIENVRKTDKRFVYDEIPLNSTYKDSGRVEDLLITNGIRRNFVMKKYDAKMYLNLGADFKFTDENIFQKIKTHYSETKKDVILIETKVTNKTYPVYPINKHSFIDLTNFCYTKKIARKFKYPEDIDPRFDVANDYRYFNKIVNFNVLEGVYGVKDGRTHYKTIEQLHYDQYNKK